MGYTTTSRPMGETVTSSRAADAARCPFSHIEKSVDEKTLADGNGWGSQIRRPERQTFDGPLMPDGAGRVRVSPQYLSDQSLAPQTPGRINDQYVATTVSWEIETDRPDPLQS